MKKTLDPEQVQYMEKVLHYKDSRNDKLNFGNSHSYSAVDNLKQTYRENGAKTKRV